MERTRIQDLVIGLIVFLIGLYGIISAFGMPDGTKPYTLVVTIIFAFLGGLLAVRSIIYRKTPSSDCEVVHVAVMKNPMIAFVRIVAYALLMDTIGFFVSSALFMFIMMLWMGYKKYHVILLTIAGMLGFIYLLFVYQLHVALPSGFLF